MHFESENVNLQRCSLAHYNNRCYALIEKYLATIGSAFLINTGAIYMRVCSGTKRFAVPLKLPLKSTHASTSHAWIPRVNSIYVLLLRRKQNQLFSVTTCVIGQPSRNVCKKWALQYWKSSTNTRHAVSTIPPQFLYPKILLFSLFSLSFLSLFPLFLILDHSAGRERELLCWGSKHSVRYTHVLSERRA